MLNSRLAQESPATKLQKALVKARDQVVLNPDDLPGSWYNILADLPGDFPRPKDPDEGPSRLEFLSKVLLKHCLQQETSTDKWISIPGDVQDLSSGRAASAPLPCTTARKISQNPCPALLQEGGSLSHRVAQGQYCSRSGLLCGRRGPCRCLDRDWCGPVGNSSGLRYEPSGSKMCDFLGPVSL